MPGRRLFLFALTACLALVVVCLPAEAADAPDPADEMFFYRDDGLFRFYNVRPNGGLGTPIQAGDGYTVDWDTIIGIDLDGDGQDEVFYYRDDGLFRYYDIDPGASLGTPILEGSGYTKGWRTVSAVDLDGDGADEIFFYREDGLFRYYDIRPNGSLGQPILAGDGYTTEWDSITAIDLDGDQTDEIFFYREDGLYRYYDVRAGGNLGGPILSGDKYTTGWSSITALDLDWTLASNNLVAPLDRLELVSSFGNRLHPIYGVRLLHAGVDFRAATGEPVYAAEWGTVVEAANRGGYGQNVVIEHRGGLSTRYAHLSAINAAVGDIVQPGQRIGAVGCTGACTGPHLHFETLEFGTPVDPIPYLP